MSETTNVIELPATEETTALVFNKKKFAAVAAATVAVAAVAIYVKMKISTKDSEEQAAA
jgi:hypothetical protein